MPVVRALRVVEMQLTTAVIHQERDDETAAPGDTEDKYVNLVLVEYEARRCAVCGGRYPPFGFGPLASKGTTLWACAAHQQDVHRHLRGYGRFRFGKNLATERHDEGGAEQRAKDHSDHAGDRQTALF